MTKTFQQFIDFSVEVTCFTRLELLGTGMAELYFDKTSTAVGTSLDELLAAYAAIGPAPDRVAALRRAIFGHEKFGAIAQAITKLWYIGIWYELPRSWTETYGALPDNTTVMVSPAAYAEGLLWPAIGAHPPGAKAPGYGSWTDAPVIPSFGPSGGSTQRLPEEPDGTAPTIMQTEPGHVSPHPAPKPQHPPPSPQGHSS